MMGDFEHKNTVKTGENRDKNGRFTKGNSGNPHGRPENAEIDLLRKAVAKVHSEKGRISIYEHFILRAYEDNTVLIAVMRKLVPDLKSVESNISSGGLKLIIEGPDKGETNKQE